MRLKNAADVLSKSLIDFSIGGFMKFSTLILALGLLAGCGTVQKPPVYNVLNYYAPPKAATASPLVQAAAPAQSSGPQWNCQPWEVMDSGGNCLTVNQ